MVGGSAVSRCSRMILCPPHPCNQVIVSCWDEDSDSMVEGRVHSQYSDLVPSTSM